MSWGPRDSAYPAYPQSYVINAPARRGLRFSPEEYKHILLACGALIAAFTLSFLSPLPRGLHGRGSLAGPLTNFLIGLAFRGAWLPLALNGFLPTEFGPYLSAVTFFPAYINVFLGAFNRVPIPPLDGSKVLAWNPAIWIAALAAIAIVFVGFFLPGLFLPLLSGP